MKIWFDTEFIEDGKTIDLISIGMIREDGAELYLQNDEINWDNASQWVLDNVKPHLSRFYYSKKYITESIIAFAGEKPEFWAYYCSYDWVVLCQLFGTMMELPKGWPMFCRDLVQEAKRLNLILPKQETNQHHALADAIWTRDAWQFTQDYEKALALATKY
jgi:hypothetical protein